MAEIVFTASFGFDQKTVKLSKVSAGSYGCHIYIDNYYHGTLVKIKGQWVIHANQPWYSADDIQVLTEIAEAAPTTPK